jgi:ADP-ribose pyrophosphatase
LTNLATLQNLLPLSDFVFAIMTENSLRQAQEEKSAPITRQWVHKGRVISLRTDTLQKEGEKEKKWDIVIHPGAVVILPITKEGHLLLVKQWRRAAEKILIELPAGTLEEGEPPLECAKRELQEETGFRAEKWTALGGFFSAPGFCNEYLHLYLALDLTESYLEPDETEAIDLLSVDIKTALKMIEQNEICDAKTILGILRYALSFAPKHER